MTVHRGFAASLSRAMPPVLAFSLCPPRTCDPLKQRNGDCLLSILHSPSVLHKGDRSRSGLWVHGRHCHTEAIISGLPSGTRTSIVTSSAAANSRSAIGRPSPSGTARALTRTQRGRTTRCESHLNMTMLNVTILSGEMDLRVPQGTGQCQSMFRAGDPSRSRQVGRSPSSTM
jgi:hypothetical protein